MDPRLLVFVLVILPVLSVCVGFTVHYAIRPMIESLIDALHELGALSRPSPSSHQLERLETEVHELRQEVRRLRAVEGHKAAIAEPSDVLGLPGE